MGIMPSPKKASTSSFSSSSSTPTAKPRESKRHRPRRPVPSVKRNTDGTPDAPTVIPSEEDYALATELFDPFAFLLDNHVRHRRAKKRVPPAYPLRNASERHVFANLRFDYDQYPFCPAVPAAVAAILGVSLPDAQRAMNRLCNLQHDAASLAYAVRRWTTQSESLSSKLVAGLRRAVKALQRVERVGPVAALLDLPADDRADDELRESLKYPVGIDLSGPPAKWTREAWIAVLSMADARAEEYYCDHGVYASEKAASRAYLNDVRRSMNYHSDRGSWEKHRRCPFAGDPLRFRNSSTTLELRTWRTSMPSAEAIDRYLDEPIVC